MSDKPLEPTCGRQYYAPGQRYEVRNRSLLRTEAKRVEVLGVRGSLFGSCIRSSGLCTSYAGSYTTRSLRLQGGRESGPRVQIPQ